MTIQKQFETFISVQKIFKKTETRRKIEGARVTNDGIWHDWFVRNPVQYWMSAVLHCQSVGKFRSRCYNKDTTQK